jgi:ammonium transporter, Amt family
MKKVRWLLLILILGTGAAIAAEGPAAADAAVAAAAPAAAPAAAEAAAPGITDEMFTVNNVWMMVCTFLVFIMHLGFATVESGLTRAKNTVNILFKNVSIVSIGLLTYAVIGFGLMYPGAEFAGKLFGFAGWGIGSGPEGMTSAYNPGYTYWTDFLFQGMFAATAATIISGAVAERIKLSSFLVFSVVYVGLCYPVMGMWKWGGGWLQALGFHDFAGSTLVHSIGGWGALVGAIMLGPRLGKYSKNGKMKPIIGHSMPLATIGVMLLWLGWFGFNGGSVLSAAPGATSRVLVTTNLAAAAGVIGAMLVSWFIQKKPDLSMILNGSLAGLVGITASADVVTPMSSIIIGGLSGMLVVLSVMAFDRLKIDDPVGALSVHLVCGVWGTIAVGIFGSAETGGLSYALTLKSQLIGVLAVGAFSLLSSAAIFFALKKVMGLRVEEAEEMRGLDIGEHGMEAYGGFQIFTTQ